MSPELDENKLRLLSILYLYTKPASNINDVDRYIKEYALLSIVYYLIVKGMLDYDYSSRLVLWHGGYVFMNISQEAIADLEYLIQHGYVQKIKFSTSSHLYVVGYRITQEGIEFLENNHKDQIEVIRKELSCPNGELKKIVIEDEDAFFVCEEGPEPEPTGCRREEDVSYESEPILL